ncbi:chitin synthase chs-1-like [Etheostoma cragini]|uniref:chitin synthase chs-1-like n=1 Tax=Etheostoma cragini TaxID=417921 RepID=UPI00155EAA12|nr:chitin synthase chs-1-like [Etheostoma cragini]
MDEDRSLPKRPWDTCREVPIIEDEQTPWKMIKLLKIITLCVVALIVFGLAVCSKTSFLLLITLSKEDTKTLSAEQKPVALLCIGCALIASSVLLLQKSLWKACYKSSKLPDKKTVALVMFFEFLAAIGAAILTMVAMPHLDIVTNVTILNGVAVLSALLQVITQCAAKERNRFLLPSIIAFILILLGYALFLYLYIMKDPTDSKMIIWVGLAVGSSFLVSFNWWEGYLRLISVNSTSVFLRELCRDTRRCQNMLNIISSLLRIAVTACVLGAYVPLAKMDWKIVTLIPSRETKIIAIIIGVQLISSALCHWFSLVACKMHALRRCFIVPLYLASLAVMVLFVAPVIVYYQDYRTSLNGTSINFTGYCNQVVDGRTPSLNGSVFPQLVLDVTHTLCFLDMSKMADIGLLTGSAVSWWLGLVLATLHLWYLSLYRIQRTQDLFIRRLYEGGFLEQSLLLNTRFDIQTTAKRKQFTSLAPVKVFLCATMWHENYNEMMKMLISIFRLDKYRPKKEGETSDVNFEAHIYFDDAFRDVPGCRGRQVNEYAEMLVEIIREVYG